MTPPRHLHWCPWLLLFAAVPGAAADEFVGSRVCRPCHAAIYEAYLKTPMARSSGRVDRVQNTGSSEFMHERSGYRYRITGGKDGPVLHFQNGGIQATHAMPYFVGSGAAARSYLLDFDGFLYQSPVAYYTAARKWDMAPGYSRHDHPFLARPIVPGCLQCHASMLQHVRGTQNRYASPPFLESGVTCERCHGSGAAHVSSNGQTGIVNPAKLDAKRRDSVCSQCHLSGEVRLSRAGRDIQAFKPGAVLSDFVTVFVRAGAGREMKVTSHVENLAQSACKRAAGDRMWCGTCHNPHAAQSSFRSRCLACHEQQSCRAAASARAEKNDECTACHMPANSVIDAEHVVYTDHSIPRRPVQRRNSPSTTLVPFDGMPAGVRDLGIAHAIVGQHGRAMQLLRSLDEPDAEAMVYLAELYNREANREQAIALYEKATRMDPAQLTAYVSLGAIRMDQGNYDEAIRLWRDALAKNPALVLVRFNLALALAKTGERVEAKRMLEQALEFNPAFTAARHALQQLHR